MPYFEEWKTYTKAVVKLSYRDRNGAGSSYVISNVNTKGFPDTGCGAHLESISITSPSVLPPPLLPPQLAKQKTDNAINAIAKILLIFFILLSK